MLINNTLDGYLKDIEIYGNTWQDSENLADIRSVGTKVEGQELYKIDVLSTGKNLFDNKNTLINKSIDNNGNEVDANNTNTSGYIKIKSNTDYVTNIISWGRLSFYDENKNFLFNKIGSGNDSVYANSRNAKYIRITFNISTVDVQLEEGTQATPYEPYQEDKLTILSPVQLEKVGDVADRIICKDGVWGVEKNIINLTFTGIENWRIDTNDTFYMSSAEWKGVPHKTNCVCITDIFASATNANDINDKMFMGNTYLFMIKPSGIASVNEWKSYLNANNLKVKYVTTQPKFIPLPHDQQVKLRTFADRTNIYFETEIEPILKAQVPKSLGATVNTHTSQIDCLNKELDRVKKLEESTVSTVTSDKAFTTVRETSNGYFEDVKLEGKTLVNRFILYKTYHNNSNVEVVCDNYKSLKGVFTIPNISTRDIGINIYNIDTDVFIRSVNIKPNSSYVIDLDKENAYLYNIYGTNANGWTTPDELTKIAMFIEGDHTDKDLSYFEGLKSVGQGVDEIEISSVNENLWTEGDLTIPSTLWSKTEFKYQFKNNTSYTVTGKHRCNADSKNPRLMFKYTDGTTSTNSTEIATTTLTDFSITSDSNKTIDIIKIAWSSGSGADINYELKDIMLSKSNSIKPYTAHKQDKKEILYYNPTTQTWEKPVLREWDSIEKHSDGKYYYHKRSEEVVLNGSEGWGSSSYNSTLENYSLFYWNSIAPTPYQETSGEKVCNIFSDKFKTLTSDKTLHKELINEEGIATSIIFPELRLVISKSKLSTQDVAGFKAWLQANPTTVVYKLAQEEVYECTNLDLITYPNETNLIVSSGAIQSKLTLKVLSNVSNVVKLLQEKVSILESDINKYMISQNRSQLDATYKSDSVTFKIDYVNSSKNMTNDYSEDLYNLILDNILVGKDNYNYNHMFNLIMDYASWNKITWEQFDELVLLMDLQHNPIEELPEELN